VHIRALEEIAPESADYYYLRYEIADGREQKLELLNRAIEIDPAHSLALLNRMHVFKNSFKDFNSALMDCERMIAARPRSSQGYRYKSYVYQSMRDYEQAREAIERALEIDPDAAWNYSARFELNNALGLRDESLADIDRAIELNPNMPRFLTNRAGVYNRYGEYDTAIADARRAIALNPDFTGGYYQLAWAYWNLKRIDELRAVMEEVRERSASYSRDETSAAVHRALSSYHRLLGDLDEALDDAKRAIEFDPDNLGGYRRRAEVKRQVEGEAGIVEDCDLMAALELDEPWEILNRGNTMRDFCNRPDEAMKNYDRAIELYPHWADPYRMRGWLQGYPYGNHEAAITDYNKAIELQPKWTEAIFNRGQTYFFLERFEEALKDYERCFALGAEGNNGRWALAQAQLRAGRESDALETMEFVVEKWPAYADSYSRQALMFFWLGRVENAMDAVTRGIEKLPQESLLCAYRAFFASFIDGSCEEIEADLAKQRELAPDEADAWRLEAHVHVLGMLFTCPEYYDSSKALSLARKAVEFNSRQAYYQGTFGAALYRNGRYTEAHDALREAAGLFTAGEEPANLFFLAMTSWRLGDKNDARSYYDRAVVRMHATYPKNPENVRARNEAAELLGIQP
jgi:tetratricopeptide (TPR) repeat protein